jgi:hypothetical protein
VPTITVLSWNVESLGDGKGTLPGLMVPTQSEVVNFLRLAIQDSGADLVGIMEVKSGRGAYILNWLLALLNNGPPQNPGDVWDGRVSSRQDGGTQEEYLLLWKHQANVLALDPAGRPGPTALVGVVDGNALETLVAPATLTPDQVKALLAALAASGYVQPGQFLEKSSMRKTATARVVPAKWGKLNVTNPPPVTFAVPPAPQPPALTPAQRQALAVRLKDTGILRFLTYGSRSPYVGNFLVGTPPKRLMVSLLHAAGPGDLDRLSAIGVMALAAPMTDQVAQDSLLVMGDFNVEDSWLPPTGRQYVCDANGFHQVTPLKALDVHPVFEPITSAPLNAPELTLPQPRTSLTNAYLADSSPITATRGSTYDKFFFHGSTTQGRQVTASAQSAYDLITATASNQGAFKPALGQSALVFYRAFRGADFLVSQAAGLTKKQPKAEQAVKAAQKKLDAANAAIGGGHVSIKSPLANRQATAVGLLKRAKSTRDSLVSQKAAITALLTTLQDPTVTAPTGIGSALSVYRFAISDHLPITVKLAV